MTISVIKPFLYTTFGVIFFLFSFSKPLFSQRKQKIKEMDPFVKQKDLVTDRKCVKIISAID